VTQPREGRPPERYSGLQIGLHWTIAALIILQLVYNEPMQQAFEERVGDGRLVLPGSGALVHIVAGTTVLLLALVRVFVRFRRGVPGPHEGKPMFVTWIGEATHVALYAMIFAMPLTGLVAWLFAIEGIAAVHEVGRLVFIPLIGLHVIGALAEHFVFKNDGLMRMFRPATGRR
jgi:cytochrome b561